VTTSTLARIATCFYRRQAARAEQQRAHTLTRRRRRIYTDARGGRTAAGGGGGGGGLQLWPGLLYAAAAAAARGARPTSIVSEIREIESRSSASRVRPFLVVAFAAISEICSCRTKGGCKWCGGRAAVVVANSSAICHARKFAFVCDMWVLRVPKLSVPKV